MDSCNQDMFYNEWLNEIFKKINKYKKGNKKPSQNTSANSASVPHMHLELFFLSIKYF